MTAPRAPAIAWFVTPHGFGHAARSVAVIEALRRQRPELRAEIFTRVPRWFFEDSLGDGFRLHDADTDVGLVQKSSLEEDASATVAKLREFLPFSERRVGRLAERLAELDCRLVACDVSPLGIAVARAASLPSVLIENFTWDWIYDGYLAAEPELRPFARQLKEIYRRVDLRVQTEPACRLHPDAERVPPVSRAFRSPVGATRRRLAEGDRRPLVLVTMGGIEWRYDFLDRLAPATDFLFVVPGGAEAWERRGNLVLLPHRSPLYHPDLVAAADVVVGKPGYSTVAEAFRAGTRMVLVDRPRFPETPVLTRFVRRHLPAVEIGPDEFRRGTPWVSKLPDLLARPRPEAVRENGADTLARRLSRLV